MSTARRGGCQHRGSLPHGQARLYSSSGRRQRGWRRVSSEGTPPEERNIGYVFQDYALFPHLTALKNANYAYKNNSSQLTEEYVLESLNLVNHKNKYPYELSGGQQQRVALARAILMQPDALIMDEPFSGLDKENIINTQQLLSDAIKILNIPAVMVTHSLEHIDKMNCKEIIKI